MMNSKFREVVRPKLRPAIRPARPSRNWCAPTSPLATTRKPPGREEAFVAERVSAHRSGHVLIFRNSQGRWIQARDQVLPDGSNGRDPHRRHRTCRARPGPARKPGQSGGRPAHRPDGELGIRSRRSGRFRRQPAALVGRDLCNFRPSTARPGSPTPNSSAWCRRTITP